MGERIQNSVLTPEPLGISISQPGDINPITFTDIVCAWLKENTTCRIESSTRDVDYCRTLFYPDVYQNIKTAPNYGIIIDESQMSVVFRYDDPTEVWALCDLRALHPTSLTFFDDLKLSVESMNAHVAGKNCTTHIGKQLRAC